VQFKDELERALVEMLYALWRSVDVDLKRKYARQIWRMFGERVDTGARTSGNSPARFMNYVALKLQATPAANGENALAVTAISEYDALEVMRRLRAEHAYLVALTRVYNDAMKEQE